MINGRGNAPAPGKQTDHGWDSGFVVEKRERYGFGANAEETIARRSSYGVLGLNGDATKSSVVRFRGNIVFLGKRLKKIGDII